MSESPRLILASASPRRQALLQEAGFPFSVDPADIDESRFPAHLSPEALAEFLAAEKARVVMRRHPVDVVLAADTVVSRGGQALGKPEDASDARRMLDLLAGTTHEVITGIAVGCVANSLFKTARVVSQVHMRVLTEIEVERYLASEQWRGKAGGYGLQDAHGFPTDDPDKDPFVANASGSRTNIVGLPMDEARQLLRLAGITAPA